jgi:predicted esterase
MRPTNGYAAGGFFLVLAAAAAALAQKPPATTRWVPPPPSGQSIEIASERKIGEFRFFVPRLVYRPRATILIQAPSRAVDALVGEQGPPAIRCVVKLTGSGRSTTAPAVFERIPRRDPTTASTRATQPATTRKGEPPVARAAVEIGLADWDDGPVTARLQIESPSEMRFAAPAAQVFPIARKAVAAVAPAHRDELACWIDDANAARPIWGKMPTWPNLDAALACPQDPYGSLRGFMLRSYDNPQLGRRQPYTLYVPRALDLSRPAPLLILLHGSGGDYRNLVADEAAGQRFEEHPMLIANAGAFHYQEFRHLALNDVRWIIQDVAAKYAVDPSRIYLQGISLGGRGTLEIAALMPDLFAAVSPQGVYGIQRAWIDPASILRRDAVAAQLSARSDIRTWLPNLRNTPVEMVFGWKDNTTPPANALMLAACIRHCGGTAVERGFDADHDISLPAYDWATTRQWFLKHRRNGDPDAVVHRVSNLRFGKSAWVTLTELHDYALLGEVVARYDAKQASLNVQTQNVRALWLSPPGPLATMTVNNMPAPVDGHGTFGVELSVDGQGTRLARESQPAGSGPSKRPGLSGPMWDVFSEPVVYVYGSGADAATTDRLRKSAELSAEWDMAFGEDLLPVVRDDQVTQEQKRRCNLILFCSDRAPSNRLRAEVDVPPLPQPVTSASATQPARSEVRLFLRPSPWAANRYALIVESSCERPANLHELGWWDKALHADWLIAVLSAGQRGRRSGARIIAAGMYDGQWQMGRWTREDFRSSELLGPGANR